VKLAFLSLLYIAQGLPFGFQSNALPLFLTESGVSIDKVTLARALAAPWLLKALWAPLVDRYGTRKRWIVPAQLGMSVVAAALAMMSLDSHLGPVMAALLVMNVFAATQDIAVDGLAVDWLSRNELGLGNGAQVVGYKVGMALGGGVLVAALAGAGLQGPFGAMAVIFLAVAGVVAVMPLPSRQGDVPTAQRLAYGARVMSLLRRPGAGWLLLTVATYKLGETVADALLGPWLVSVRHLPKETVALWLGGWGIGGSILGSLFGAALATRLSLGRALGAAAGLRLVPLVLQWVVVMGWLPASAEVVVPVTIAEHLFGGALTTCMFAFMMSNVDPSLGATQFTLLASIEVLGKAPVGVLAGLLARYAGYSLSFAFSVLASLAFLVVLAQSVSRLKSPKGLVVSPG
jgi:MFS transporter, PAT family, beta-lactamase induction signal transducer AmpG